LPVPDTLFIQHHPPNLDPAYLGRVFSVLVMLESLIMPLGMVLWGPMGDVAAIN